MKTIRYFFVGLFSLLSLLMLPQTANAENNISPRCKVVATHTTYTCSTGKNGVRMDKKEGDGATPAGNFLIRKIFYRADKLNEHELTMLKKLQVKGFAVQALSKDDGWVDDIKSADYNKYVKISALKDPNTSHENLWRDDDVYDIIAVIGYNDAPIVKGKGSAIFMHVARPSYAPTVGCVAFSKADLLKVLATLTPKTQIDIPEKGDIVFR